MSRRARAVADCEEAIQRAQAQLDGTLTAHQAKLRDLDKYALAWREELSVSPYNDRVGS